MRADDMDAVLDLARANLTPDKLPDNMEARTPAPEGEAWRVVPIKPTEAMLVNGREALMPLVRLDSYGPLIGVWEDMLAASPVVPVGSADTLERQADEINRLRLALVEAGMRIETCPGADESRVEIIVQKIRAAMTEDESAPVKLSD
jgi:hypothetical protein